MLTLGAALVGAALSSSELTPPPLQPAPDRFRTAMVATSWSLVGLNATVAPLAVLAEGLGRIDCRNCSGDTRAPWLSTLPMVFTPSLPRWAVGDVKGALLFTGLRGASWGAAALLVSSSKRGDPLPVVLTAYALPLALSVVDLVTAPHREDLAPPQGPSLRGVAPSPLVDGKAGLHGMTLAAAGTF
jgi:hypothetical protein